MQAQPRRHFLNLATLLIALAGCGEPPAPAGSASSGTSGAAGAGPSGGAPGAAGTGGGGGALATGGSPNDPQGGAGPSGGTDGGTGGDAGGGGTSALLPAPSGLLCELLSHPEQATITDPRPELGFVVGSRQLTAVRILVASDRSKLERDEGDLWDTGRQESTQSIDIEYGGAPLQPSKTYFWKVKTWGEGGAESAWSEMQSFVTAASLGVYSTPRHAIAQTPVAPATLKQLAADRVFVDFGRDAFGWLELELNATKAATLTVRLGEQATGDAVNLTPGGSIRAASVTVAVQPGARKYRVETPKDSRNTSGEAIRLPASLGVVMPFRYVEISGAPMALEASMIRQISIGTSHSSLHSNLFPLAFGLVPAERRAKVVAFVESRGMACSVYAAQYLLEALYESGEEQAALALLTSETDRSWMNMLKVGATIAMEAWDAKYKPNLDWNNAWGGAPANILPRYLLGVRPLTPGFAKAEIRPRPSSLGSAAGRVPTGPHHSRADRGEL